jgi:predicted RNA binding protein YcfA (HicA-like mRNA interferase family)
MFRERILPNGWGAWGMQSHGKRGSHLRLTTSDRDQHHVTIPNHDPLKVGTLAGILNEVAGHLEISRDELIQQLFG